MKPVRDPTRVTVRDTSDTDTILRGAVDIVPDHATFETLLRHPKPLRVKCGFDPTMPDLHLGHAVLLRKMRQLQDAGHTVIVLIGDYTARIGDPSGRDKQRPTLSKADIDRNAQTYAAQAFCILDRARTEVRYNSEWMDGMTAADFIRLSSYSLARMLEREDFKQRFRRNHPISIHEILYPLVQGYDSVALACDVELGGTDQLFNLLIGRDIQERYGQPPQAVLTMPLLVGLDGVKKMSKSSGNVIALTDSADEMTGKIMSISDDLMWDYFTLASSLSTTEIASYQQTCAQGDMNPRDAKLKLAEDITGAYWGEESATAAVDRFVNRFSKRAVPVLEEMDPFDPQEQTIATLLVSLKACSSTSQARVLLQNGAVHLGEQRLQDPKAVIPRGTDAILRVGKRRIYRIRTAENREISGD